MTATKNIDPSCATGRGGCFATANTLTATLEITTADAVSSTVGIDRSGQLLDRTERFVLGLRLTLALAALCLVGVASGIYFLLPASTASASGWWL